MTSKKQASKIFKNYPPPVPAMDITPADDAFHGSKKRIAAEWWYFDANFTNNYSLHIGCRTFSKKKNGMVSPFLEIYKDGKLIAKAVKRFSFNKFETSSDYPLVKLANNTIIQFNQELYNKKEQWVYNVTLEIENHGVDLIFKGATKGFKYQTKAESWTVALPKATVEGEITVNGKKIKVNGIGYHDHNWNYSLLTPLTYGKGWYWGKLMSKSLTVSWAEIIKSPYRGEILAVVSQDGKGYIPTNAEKIFFKPEKFIRNNRREMPTSFDLKIDDVVNGIPIKVDVKMETYEIHYNKVLIIAPYWRYHVKAKGYITVGSNKEQVNETQIMEFLKFS
ncbi:hypothetical protein AYK24_01680 [Thermoplasmatales archaeon SG8-52-4]|nr:MAG: hypothetical protein AYK24_01680 [Thermoplasmatales archaeon SG8-52-4]